MSNTKAIAINYSDERLRILVEEYITQQRTFFTLKGVCSYVLYWAMEDGHTTNAGLHESNQLAQVDCARISKVMQTIASEGRITAADNDSYSKTIN